MAVTDPKKKTPAQNLKVDPVVSMNIAGGALDKTRRNVVETLETPGLDGRRFRRVFKQSDPQTIVVVWATTTYDLAVKKAIYFREQKGKRFFLIIGTKMFDEVFISESEAEVLNGGAYSASLSGPYAVQWTLVIHSIKESVDDR